MRSPQFLDTPDGRQLAYHQTEGQGPGVVFLGGLKSDMTGTKAMYLENWAKETGRQFLRFDYSGHGSSSGDFLDGSIGDWTADAIAAISTLTEGAQILVGSSMGGWISLLVARAIADKIAGLVGIAVAPDFTEDDIWQGLSEDQKSDLMRTGQVALPSDYSDEPYIFTRHLIEDGRNQLVLRAPLSLPFPTRFLQGTADKAVDMSLALRLLEHATGNDIRLTLVKDADHRFSNPQNLQLIRKSIHSVTMAAR